MKKLYTLKEELNDMITIDGVDENSTIGIDKRNRECLIEEITLKELMSGKYENLMEYKVKDVTVTESGKAKCIFILNSNKVELNTKKEIHKELKRVLRGFENMELYEDSLYEMLLKIEDNWDVITK